MVIRVRARGDGQRRQRAVRVVDSIAAVAEFAGVTVPSASAWFERGAPTLPDEHYDLWAIAQWHAQNSSRSDGGAGADDATAPNRAQWEVRRVRASALEAEQRLDLARGRVIPRTEHDRTLFALIDSFVSALENLPPKVSPLLTAARGHHEVDQILRDHIRTMRIQLVAKHSPEPRDVTAGTENASEAEA
jgi:phage terminase Nu1 subunit (DNA packaging protein)